MLATPFGTFTKRCNPQGRKGLYPPPTYPLDEPMPPKTTDWQLWRSGQKSFQRHVWKNLPLQYPYTILTAQFERESKERRGPAVL